MLSLLFAVFILKAEQLTNIQIQSNHIIDSLKKELLTAKSQTQTARLLLQIGGCYETINPESSIQYYNKALSIIGPAEVELNIKLLNAKGSAYQLLHDFSSAIFLRFQALRIAEKYHEEGLRADVLNNLGSTYIEIKQYALAEKIFKKILDIRIKNHQNKDLALLYTNMGALAGLQGQPKLSVYYCTKAIDVHKQFPSKMGLHLPFINMGDAYMQLNRLQDAKLCYGRALSEAKNMEDLVDCYRAMGEVCLRENRTKEALNYFLKAENLATESNLKRMFLDLYKAISQIYVKLNDLEKALEYKEKYISLMNDAFNERVTRQMNEMQVKYEAEKKDKQIEALNKDTEIAQARIEKEQLKRNLILLIFTFILVIGIVVARNSVLKQRIHNKHLKAEKALIENDNVKLLKENAEAKYEVLKSKINPHFLFNSLSTLASIMNDKPKLALEFIERFSELYRVILQTENLKLVTLKDEMRVVENYLYLQKVRFEDNLILNLDVGSKMYKYSVPPFCIQMVVENAIKHNTISDNRKLTIELHIEDDSIVIQNNLQKKFSQIVSTGIGQENIKERYKLVTKRPPIFFKTHTAYIVKLPLVKEAFSAIV